jgi:DnaK suppressor protein
VGAVLHGHDHGLTWKNSSLNTGTKLAPVRDSRNRDRRRETIFGERMGKSSQKRTAKKAVAKSRARSSPNGRDGAAPKGKLVKAVQKRKSAAVARKSGIVLAAGYRPTETEPFMNERHRTYFRNKLVAWKEEIVRQNRETLHLLHEDSAQHADIADRATSETDRALELRARDRQRKLIAKIDSALSRIEDGSYGFCEETGEPIGLRRLEARPIATLSLEAQERHERREKVFRED